MRRCRSICFGVSLASIMLVGGLAACGDDTEVVPTEVVPTEVVPTEVVPTEVVPVPDETSSDTVGWQFAGVFVVLVVVGGILTARKVRAAESPSVLGWLLVALGLLSPILAGILAWVFLGDAEQSADAEAKSYVFLVAGLLAGLVLIVTGLVVLLGNRLSSEATTSRGGALPGVGAAAREAPWPWAVAGLVVASVGWVFVGSYGPLFGLMGGALAAIGGAKGERNAGMVMLYALVVTTITLSAPVWLS